MIKTESRCEFLPYCLPMISEEEIEEVVDTLRSGWLTTGPKVRRFEIDFAAYVGVRHAIAVSSCTAALHIALKALGVQPGDEVIVPSLTFCATANVVVHLGAKPVLVDVDEHGHISLDAAERAVSDRTRAIVPVHYAGQACDMNRILDFGRRHNLRVVEDAAHGTGAEFDGQKVGTHGDAVAFSFYVTKNITTGEGGMITTNCDELGAKMRLLSLHGMSGDAWRRYEAHGSWFYEVLEPGFKNNMTDIQASLGIHQLRRLAGFIARRRAIAGRYAAAFGGLPELHLPIDLPLRPHTFHLYPIQLQLDRLRINRQQFIEELDQENIGTSVHFIPLHKQPFYQRTFGYLPEDFPVAERIYAGLVSLPLYPRMSDSDVERVVSVVRRVIEASRR
jgi:dTDP-4-amino-4,6-dideoxygalactose transaminase